MSTRNRNIVFQRWSGVLQRETRDIASLDQICQRALADSDVREDPTLQNMIRAEVQKLRADLQQKIREKESSAASAESRPDGRSELPKQEPAPAPATTPKQDRKEFNQLARTLCSSLERRNETETQAVLGKMKALQEQRPEAIPAAVIAKYELRVEELRAHVGKLTGEIAALTTKAIEASRNGGEQNLARSMRRLTAIHAAHPLLLDEPSLEDVRRDVARAAEDRRQHQQTTSTLLKRERAITAEIKTLAVAVRDFHRVACEVPDSSEDFHKAEATYLRTLQRARTYDTEWFSGVVLELADLLAEWTVPPLGAEGQIDRFLDSISAGLDTIRAEMREIESEQDSDEGA